MVWGLRCSATDCISRERRDAAVWVPVSSGITGQSAADGLRWLTGSSPRAVLRRAHTRVGLFVSDSTQEGGFVFNVRAAV